MSWDPLLLQRSRNHAFAESRWFPFERGERSVQVFLAEETVVADTDAAGVRHHGSFDCLCQYQLDRAVRLCTVLSIIAKKL